MEGLFNVIDLLHGNSNGIDYQNIFFQMQKSKSWDHIAVKRPLLELIRKNVLEKFLAIHPDRAGSKITDQEIILDSVILYLEARL